MLVFRMLCRITQSSDAHRTESVSVMDHEQTMGVNFRVMDQKQQNLFGLGVEQCVRSNVIIKGLRRPAACCCFWRCSVWKTRHSVYFECELFDRCSTDQSHNGWAAAHVAPVKWTSNCPETRHRLIFVGRADCTRHISANIIVSHTGRHTSWQALILAAACRAVCFSHCCPSVCLSVCLSVAWLSSPSQYVSITASPTCAAVYVTD